MTNNCKLQYYVLLLIMKFVTGYDDWKQISYGVIQLNVENST